ncbi:hypothetical protein OKW21_003856 [Catalinimonas alkaloidigena]|uniref:gluconate 2-dehydrogenase subunit 3 family protein n=1 Tax=Catalinimonas alkaloidigena TaxID=1075417 RepID=UPI002405F3AB|nr:gluconate 2-dehydrogenase subunit 3 family protein [Catalinimonas alkaloidigena]MDF9798593.1 hypothetical protein [Catalinimonas alkaloidigena]
MNRRTALKQAALFAGGIALIPSCNFGPEREAVALDNLQLDLDLQDLLARVIETIIPSAKESPGAESLNLYRFVLVMMDDCEPKENQETFVNGLKQIVPFAKAQIGRGFVEDDQQKNEEVLTSILAMEESEEEKMAPLQDIKAFINLAKHYTIQGYMASEYIMTEKFPYKLVPGPYQDCVSTEGLIVM